MQRRLNISALFALSLIFLQYAYGLVIENAEREIQVLATRGGQMFKLTFKNDGQQPEEQITVCHPTELFERRAAYLVHQTIGEGAAPLEQQGPPRDAEGNGFVCLDFKLKEPLAPGKTTVVTVNAAFVKLATPYPKEIKQLDPHRIMWTDTAYIVSPYKVLNQKTTVNLNSKDLESHKAPEPSKFKSGTLTLGPYKNINPFTAPPAMAHYKSVYPFQWATTVTREIDVSAWGNIYFDEWYNLANIGAKTTGEWSRYDLMMNGDSSKVPAITDLAGVLPPQAQGVYFRDEIGNISTSLIQYNAKDVRLALVPRYPIFGGWSAKLNLGWTVSSQYLTTTAGDGTGRTSLVTIVGPAVADLPAEELIVKVVLPEGASDVTAALDLQHELSWETKYTYLDVLGRKILTLKITNYVPERNVVMTVTYRQSSFALLQKVVMVLGLFGFLFALAMVRSGSEKRNAAAQKEKAS